MDTKIIKYPHSELEIFRYYFPDSLIGQANGVEAEIQPEPDIHMDLTREDGAETCSCGLLYLDSPYQRYGHRNHRTGLPEQVFKFLSAEGYRNRGDQDYAKNIWVNCERCAMSIKYSDYLSKRSSHDCWMEHFEQAHCSMENAKRMIIDQTLHFKLDLVGKHSDEVVHVSLAPTLDGLKISTSDPTHLEALLTFLETKTIVFSEEALVNYLLIEPSPETQRAFAKNDDDMNKFLIGSKSHSNYRLSYGGGEGWFRAIPADSELPLGTRYSLTRQQFSRHCIGTGVTVLRIPVAKG
jgi:hypothetical protein